MSYKFPSQFQALAHNISRQSERLMVNRREFVGITLGAGATLALNAKLLRALEQQAGGKLIQRAIPSSGEMVPVIGLSFSNHPTCADHAALKEVLKTFVANGGRVFDAMHTSVGNAEEFHATVAKELGVQDKLFWSTRGIPGGGQGGPGGPGAAAARAHVESWLSRLNVPKIDLVMLPPQIDPAHLGVLKEMKKDGRIRYIGVQVIGDPLYPQLESVMRNAPIDFIGVDYDIANRARVEDTILPLAQERKIGVMAFFPLGNNSGLSCGGTGRNLFARVGKTPLPEWAAEFDAKTWAQFFIKYIVSHPAITVVRVGTTKASHMLDDMSGGIGRLPDEAMRKRMAAFIDALPELPPMAPPPQAQGIVLPAAVLDRYVGEYKAASGFTAIIRREGEKLFVKPGNNPEAPLIARTETRFQDPRGPFFEFQLDSQGKVTGAVLEQQGPQGTQRMTLERK